ncbi:glucosyltransferase domain-containing protein [Rahnella bonaserana]|uniref:glucosyltransferase domain-containing protein n=1 Tax=Rahnella bonaserana TaxID=2816248 RepID=UPI00320B5A68
MNDIVEQRVISHHDSLSRHVSALIVFAAVMAGLSPVYLFTYAYLDDYTLVQQLIQGVYQGIAWDIMSGRPGYALLRLMAFNISTNMDSLEGIRLFASLTVAILGSYLFYFMVRRDILRNNAERIVLSLTLCLIPSLQVYTAWVTCFPFALSVLLSLASYDVLTAKMRMHVAIKFIISSALIILSFSIYQPAAMCFLAFVFIDNCLSEQKISYKKLILSFFVACIGMASSVFMAKIIPMRMYGHTLDRAAITHDIPGKLDWFVHQPLVMALKNYFITASDLYVSISVLIIIIGLASLFTGESPLEKVFLSILLAMGSFSLNLAIAESWAAYRSLIGMSMIVSAVFIYGLIRIASNIGILRFPILVGVAATAIVSSQYNIVRGFIVPQKGEIEALSSEFTRVIPKDFTGTVMFDLSNPTFYAFEKLQISDEFGGISSAAPWVIGGMAEYIKTNKGFKFNIPVNPVLSDANRCEKDCIIINTGNALRSATPFY